MGKKQEMPKVTRKQYKKQRKAESKALWAPSACAKTVRVAPRKARLVIDTIRGKNVNDAVTTLALTNKQVTKLISKVLKNAINNAINGTKEVPGLKEEKLYVVKAYVNEGPTLKRTRPRARGSASMINKRTSHIHIVLGEQE
jgi:large subunit ribosomal protein L22